MELAYLHQFFYVLVDLQTSLHPYCEQIDCRSYYIT